MQQKSGTVMIAYKESRKRMKKSCMSKKKIMKMIKNKMIMSKKIIMNKHSIMKMMMIRKCKIRVIYPITMIINMITIKMTTITITDHKIAIKTMNRVRTSIIIMIIQIRAARIERVVHQVRLVMCRALAQTPFDI